MARLRRASHVLRGSTPESLSPDHDNDRNEWTCDCEQRREVDADEYFMCRQCLRHQHMDCSPCFADEEIMEQRLCNKCTFDSLERVLQQREEETARLRAAVEEKRQQTRDMFASILWKQYCVLPNGKASPAVLAITATRYERGKTIPVHPPPEEWVEDVLGTMDEIEMLASEDSRAGKIVRDSEVIHNPNDGVLRPFRELAVWIIHKGPWHEHPERLGVLAEVVGIVVKGTYWDGPLEVDTFGKNSDNLGPRKYDSPHNDVQYNEGAR